MDRPEPLPMRRRRLAALAGLLPLALSRPAGAQAAPVVLTVTGLPDGGSRDFTLAQFEALGLRPLTTATPWTQGPQAFSGVPLAALLAAVGGSRAGRVSLEALNRYAVEVPEADAVQNEALLATRLDGEPMRVRDRGPIWLIYPWTARPELDRPMLHERAIWQVRRISLL